MTPPINHCPVPYSCPWCAGTYTLTLLCLRTEPHTHEASTHCCVGCIPVEVAEHNRRTAKPVQMALFGVA